MKNALKLIIDAIRIATDKIINKIPKKLSDLEIDMEIGGSSTFTVNITINDEGSPSADKTFDEIDEVIKSGGLITFSIMESPTIIPEISTYSDNNEFKGYNFIFVTNHLSVNENCISKIELFVSKENIWTFEDYDVLEFGRTDNLNTENKTIVGAINEVDEKASNAGSLSNAVLYEEQSLTAEQKAQARANISKFNWRTFKDSFFTYTYAIDETQVNYEIAQTIVNTSGNGSISALEDIVGYANTFGTGIYSDIPVSTVQKIIKNYEVLRTGGAVTSTLVLKYPNESECVYSTVYISRYTRNGATHSIQGNDNNITTTIYYNYETNTIIDWSSKYNSVTINFNSSGYGIEAKVADARFKALEESINNSSASATWDTIENKPFNKKEIVLSPKQTLTFSDVVNMGINTGILSTVIDFEVGETYTMIANGVKYECVAYEQEYMGIPIKAIGSQNFLDSVSDGSTLIYKEPYVVVTGDIGYGTMTFVAPIMQNTPSVEIEVRKCIETNVNDIRVGAEWTATEALKEKEVIFQCEDQILLDGSDELNFETKMSNIPIEDLGFEVEPDKYYIVKTNERTHIVKSKEIVLFQADEGIMKTVILGNGYILKDNLEDTGEDFCITVYRGKILGYFTTNLEESNINLTISDVEEVPDKLEPKFVDGMYYSEIYMKDVLSATTLTTTEGSEGMFSIANPLGLVAGKTYTVNWNGVEYICKAIDSPVSDYKGVVIGNIEKQMGTGDTGEPFVMIDFAELQGVLIGEIPQSSLSVTVSIKCENEEIHKIDNKYIDAEWMATKTVEVGDIVYTEKFDSFVYEEDLKAYVGMLNDSISHTEFVIGEKYVITNDMGTFTCECIPQLHYSTKEVMGVLFSNIDITPNATISVMPNNSWLLAISDHEEGVRHYITTSNVSSATLTVSKLAEVTNTLPPEFIKDMYYDDPKVLLPKATLKPNDNDTLYIGFPMLGLIEGEKYIVTHNGVKHELVAKVKSQGLYTGLVYLGGQEFGYDFDIIDHPKDNTYAAGCHIIYTKQYADGWESYEMEIIKEDIHTIDPKYIDDMYYDRKNIILPKSKLTCNDTETIYMSFAGNPLGLELDKKYDVTFNGAKYECIAYADASDNPTIHAILGGNEYPFEIIEWTSAYENNASFSVVCNGVPIEPENPYVFEIEITKRELRKIDNKFIDADWIAKKKENVTVLLPEVTIEDIIGNSSSGVDYYSFVFNNDDLNFTITKGKEYIVNFDGADYVCEVQVAHSDLLNIDLMYIGNPFLAQTLDAEDNGMPFIFSHTKIINDSATINSMTIPKNVSHTVKFNVTEVERIIEPLPQEFLPEIPTFDLTEMGLAEIPCDGSFVFKSMDTTEIINALEKGLVDVNYMAEINLGSAFEYATMSMPCTSRLVMSKAYDLKEELNYMCIVPYNLPFPDLGVEINGKVCFIIKDGSINAKQVPDVPILDLVEFGFPPLVMDGNGITSPLDESIVMGLVPILEKGLVKVRINLNDEDETYVLCGNVSCYNGRTYSFTSTIAYGLVSINVDRISNTIHAFAKSLFADGSLTDAEEVSY